MMKIKTSELIGSALDWAVACITKAGITGVGSDGKLRAMPNEKFGEIVVYTPSTDWSQGGPIIEREFIQLQIVSAKYAVSVYDIWMAIANTSMLTDYELSLTGNTPLIAAMRCYVASKLGDKVDIPDELLHDILQKPSINK